MKKIVRGVLAVSFVIFLAGAARAFGGNGDLAGTWLAVSSEGFSECATLTYDPIESLYIVTTTGAGLIMPPGSYTVIPDLCAQGGEVRPSWFGNSLENQWSVQMADATFMPKLSITVVGPEISFLCSYTQNYAVRGSDLSNHALNLPADIDVNQNGIPDYYFDVNKVRLGSCEPGADTDGDGIPDAQDNCPTVSNSKQLDSDEDGFGDACDNCPYNANSSQTDSDGDGIGDACDSITITLTPPDPSATDTIILDVAYTDTSIPDPYIKIYINRVLSKECQAYTCRYEGGPFPDGFEYQVRYKDANGAEAATPTHFAVKKNNDWDGDGVVNSEDNCPNKANPDQKNSDWDCSFDPTCGCLICAPDFDSRGDACDNCPGIGNGDQLDSDGDGRGDACDNCPDVPNYDQANSDNDGWGDACDYCRTVTTDLPFQPDYDGDCSTKKANPAYWNPQSGWLEDPHCGDGCDNCLTEPNPNQMDIDNDGSGDACDPCPSDPLNDEDLDGICSIADNCPHHPNPDQEDWDKDGIGDACDCSDNFMGPNEEGADCGGICGKNCMVVGSYGLIDVFKPVPVLINGDPKDRIDVVFVMDEDYNGNIVQFRKDIVSLIKDGYFGASEFQKCKWNFWYSPFEGDYVNSCAQWNVNLLTLIGAAFADSFGIVCTTPTTGCASGNRYGTRANKPLTAVHESGHAIFNLDDEYCCVSDYSTFDHPSGTHNIFISLQECMSKSANPGGCEEFCPSVKCWPGTAAEIQNCKNWFLSSQWPGLADTECSCQEYAAHYGQDTAQCEATTASTCPTFWNKYWTTRGVTDLNALTVKSPNWVTWGGSVALKCGTGWWKSDFDGTCLMNSDVNAFGPDCTTRIAYDQNVLPSCSVAKSSFFTKASSLGEEEKVALLRYRIQNDAVSLLDATIIYNQPPNYFLRHGKFTMSGISTSGVELFSFALADPREIDMPPQEEFTPSIGPLTDTSFSAVVPLESAMRTVQIRNAETGEVIHIADLADAILEFCEGIGYEDVQCQNSDLDTDAIPDTDDNCPLVSNEDQTDGDGDGAGDACDNCPEVYNPDQADSDGNGTGDACENGGDADRDGIPDADDLCPASDIRSSVMVGLCDTKVDNSLVENGCTMNDLITQCAENSKNHGKFVSCISHIINEWKKAGLISKQEKGTIQNCAAKAKVP